MTIPSSKQSTSTPEYWNGRKLAVPKLDPHSNVLAYFDESDWGSERSGNFHLTGVVFGFGPPVRLGAAAERLAGGPSELKANAICKSNGIVEVIRIAKALMESIDEVDYTISVEIGSNELVPALALFEVMYEDNQYLALSGEGSRSRKRHPGETIDFLANELKEMSDSVYRIMALDRAPLVRAREIRKALLTYIDKPIWPDTYQSWQFRHDAVNHFSDGYIADKLSEIGSDLKMKLNWHHRFYRDAGKLVAGVSLKARRTPLMIFDEHSYYQGRYNNQIMGSHIVLTGDVMPMPTAHFRSSKDYRELQLADIIGFIFNRALRYHCKYCAEFIDSAQDRSFVARAILKRPTQPIPKRITQMMSRWDLRMA